MTGDSCKIQPSSPHYECAFVMHISDCQKSPEIKMSLPHQSALNYGMIATGNHDRFGFAARSTTSVAISELEVKSIDYQR